MSSQDKIKELQRKNYFYGRFKEEEEGVRVGGRVVFNSDFLKFQEFRI